ncbi:MAG: ABC transporter substrate-binding protein [Acidimicrobiia bacterium]|nr:ABC transporter substrate-binding protein [Acidimicrobiia bacterium]
MQRSRTAWWRLLAIIAALGLLAAACGDDDGGDGGDDPTTESTDETDDGGGDDDTDDAAPQYGGSIVVGLEAESNTFTPGPAQLANGGTTVAMAIFDPLMAQNSEGELEGFLAETLEPNEDLTQWTLKLREGIQFHDGTPLDADTLLWNFETLHFSETSQTRGSLVSAGVTGMEVVDELTVRYNLSEPNAGFPDLLRLEAGWPISRAAYELDPENSDDNLAGTGPFKLESWTRDGEFVAVRNENYWRSDAGGNQLPYLDQITFRPITDEDARVNSLASGDVDMMQTLRGSAVKQVQALVEEGGFDANMHIGNNSGSALLNVLEPPLDDLRIRQALAYAGDADQVQIVLGDDGLTEPSTGFFSQDSPWYSETAAEAYPGYGGRDVEAASALVEEYKNDPERSDDKAVGETVDVEYSCPPDPSLIEVSQLQQQLFEEVGFTVSLRQVEQAAHIQNAIGTADQEPPFKGNYSINCWRAGGGEGDPLTALQSFFGPVATTAGNFANFTSPEIDEQLEILRNNADFATRYAAVEQISIISAQQVPILWSSPTPTIVGYRDVIRGVTDWKLPDGAMGTGTPQSVARFYEVWIDE